MHGLVNVIVIGGAYAGIAIAQQIDLEFQYLSIVNLTLITATDMFNLNHANLRAMTDESMIDKCFIPYDKLFIAVKKRKVISGRKVTQVYQNHLFLNDGQRLDFDYLAIASGSTFSCPFKFTATQSSKAKETLKSINTALQKASSVIIVGSGVSGVELAGEIATDYPNLHVRLISAAESVLANTQYSSQLKEQVVNQLQSLNVDIVYNERVLTKLDTAYSLERQTIETNVGSAYSSDIIFMCLGSSSFNSEFMISLIHDMKLEQQDILTAKGRIKVNRHGQIPLSGLDHIFAAGDVSTLDSSTLAYVARNQGLLVGKNMAALIKNDRYMTGYTQSPSSLAVISLGRNGGAIGLPFGITLGAFFTRFIKSDGLFVQKYWDYMRM